MTPERLRATIALLGRRCSEQRFGGAAECLHRLLEYAGFAKQRAGHPPSDDIKAETVRVWRRLIGASEGALYDDVRRSALAYYAVVAAASRGAPPQELRAMAYDYCTDALEKCDRYLEATRAQPMLLLAPPKPAPPVEPPKRGAHLRVVGGTAS